MKKKFYKKPQLEIFVFNKTNILTKFSTDAEVDDFKEDSSINLNDYSNN